MELSTIINILFCHWFADFAMQKGKEGANKYKDNKILTKHVAIYCLTFFAFLSVELFPKQGLSWNIPIFIAVTFVMHWITDYITSKITHGMYERKEFGWDDRPNLGFFTIVGFDQLLHYAQLFICYKTLIL